MKQRRSSSRKASKPSAKGAAKPQRLGFLKGEIEVPDDFDRMGESEIAALFGMGAPKAAP